MEGRIGAYGLYPSRDTITRNAFRLSVKNVHHATANRRTISTDAGIVHKSCTNDPNRITNQHSV